MRKPLAIDLFCGLGGWTEGLLAEGWDVIGFDIEQHAYGGHRYPAQLVLQDVRTLHGSQFRNADLFVASPPCQEYSYMAMPWTRAKKIAEEYRSGVRDVRKLTELFDACFRIQREACAAAGRHIPLIVENVRGAQKWVGRSRWNYGSFHLWGDVPALMPMSKAIKAPTMGAGWYPKDHPKHVPGLAFNTHAERVVRPIAHNTTSGCGNNPDGRKQPGNCAGDVWADRAVPRLAPSGGQSSARKAASAMIAKIPLPLARYIGRVFKPAIAISALALAACASTPNQQANLIMSVVSAAATFRAYGCIPVGNTLDPSVACAPTTATDPAVVNAQLGACLSAALLQSFAANLPKCAVVPNPVPVPVASAPPPVTTPTPMPTPPASAPSGGAFIPPGVVPPKPKP